MGRHVSESEFKALFEGGRPARISEIGPGLGVSRSTVSRLMRRHRTYTSVNAGGAYCALPSMCRFDGSGFCRIGKLLFFRDGNQLAAVVRYVDNSEAGVRLAECKAFFGVNTTMQVLGLVKRGRLRRESDQGRFVYYSARKGRYEQQRAARRAGRDAAVGAATLAEALAREDRDSLELLVNVLLTCLRHPEFSAKSVALSLIRRGCRTCTEQVRDLLKRFEIGKKGGSWR